MARYDTAQICINGHTISKGIDKHSATDQSFCDKCGAKIITNCKACVSSIRGERYLEGPGLSGGEYTPPSYCYNCGNAFPWIESRMQAARELTDELENLTKEEKDSLKQSLDDIITDTPQTTLAVIRIKRLLTKSGKIAAESFKEIMVSVVTEAAKRSLWGG
ncbi:MAG: DUF2321 domain-containing protein [Armatimonadota bacterium]